MSIFVIAEIGVNHDGDPMLAKRLIDFAADAGADAAKFQTFRADALATEAAPKAVYQTHTTDAGETQRDMLRRLELSADAHHELKAHCARRRMTFLSTPFDLESLEFLLGPLGLDTVKIGSGDLTNGPLLHRVAREKRDVILSTGMATLDEIAEAMGVLAHGYFDESAPPSRMAFADALRSESGQAALARHVTLLQCTTDYPASPASANLRAMATLHDRFGVRVGLSDHTPGIAVAIAAAALGAQVIEKHLTVDRSRPGPDHAASLEPATFAEMVSGVREAEAALGNGIKAPAPEELANRVAARKSLVAARALRRGETIDAGAMTAKRPGGDVSPMAYWDWLGRIAARDFAADEPLVE